MTTNILAAVVITLLTNVVPSDNSRGCSMYSDQFSHLVYGHDCRPYVPATEQYLTTNVTEHTEITVKLPQGPKTFTMDRTISSVTAILRKLEQWQPAGVRTNQLLQSGSITITNTADIWFPYRDAK